MIGKVNVGGGGELEVVNGIIEQYKASSGTIDANTFVEFVNSVITNEVEVEDTSSVAYPLIEKINNTQALIVYKINNVGVYARVCTINGNDITLGQKNLISSTNYNLCGLKLINMNKMFFIYTATNKLYGMVLTISGNSVTTGTSVKINDFSNSSYATLDKIDTDKVLIEAIGGNGNYAYAYVCFVSGTTITVGTGVGIETNTSNSIDGYSVTTMETNIAVATFTKMSSVGDNNKSVWASILSISGSTITVNTPFEVSAFDYIISGERNTVKSAKIPSTSLILITLISKRNAKAIILSISGTTITAASPNRPLNNLKADTSNSTLVMLDESTAIFISTTQAKMYYIYTSIIKVEDFTGTGNYTKDIVSLSSTPLYYYTASSVALTTMNDKIVAFSQTTKNVGILNIFEDELRAKESFSNKIEGITKTQCTSMIPGNVYVLNQ